MDFLTPLSYITDLVGKIGGVLSKRPRLSVEIIRFRPDSKDKRWIFRASVINRGPLAADGCEGYWSLFNPQLQEISAGTGVFWAPQSDDDYDFENRTFRTARLEYNERRFCWAEMELIAKSENGSEMHFFPYDGSVGPHTFAIVIEYCQFKAFDFVVINVPCRFTSSCQFDEVSDSIQWGQPGGLRGMLHRFKVRKHIVNVDYHEYMRPT